MKKKNKKRKVLLLTFLHIDAGYSFNAEPGHLPLCLVIFPVCSESKDQWQLKAYCLLRSSVNMFTDLRIHVTLISPHTQHLLKTPIPSEHSFSGFFSHNLVCLLFAFPPPPPDNSSIFFIWLSLFLRTAELLWSDTVPN